MPQSRLRELIQDVYSTHIEFHKEISKGQRWQAKGIERKEIVVARNRFKAALDLLFTAQLDPIRASFLADAPSSVDKVIDFLEVDIPAFRCGYEKEWYLSKLKSIPLTLMQQDRLKRITLDLVSKPHYRREPSDWGRLMTVLADETFLARLRTLAESSEHHVQQHAQRMLRTILDNRLDLSV